jgi:translation initiation factor IF-3
LSRRNFFLTLKKIYLATKLVDFNCFYLIFFISKVDVKSNKQIRDKEIKVIGKDGKMLGVMSAHEAQRVANADGLDLVLVFNGSETELPICKITDSGKYKYEKQKRAEHISKKLKEIKFHLNTGEADLAVKKKKAFEFLNKGHNLKITIVMQRHEFDLKQNAVKTVEHFAEDFLTISRKASNVKIAGKNISVVLISNVKQ